MSNWYVRPAGGTYGNEDGTSYADAWDGFSDITWASVQPGDTLWICGTHIYDMTGKAAGEKNITPTAGTSEEARVILRGDYPGDPAIIWGNAKINYGTWADEGNGTWSLTDWCGTGASGQTNFFFENVNGNDGTHLNVVDTLQACKDTPGSVYSADYAYSGTIYCHLTDGSDPGGKLYAPYVGWSFYPENRQYITFQNMTIRSMRPTMYDQTGSYLKFDNIDLKYALYAAFPLGEGHHHIEISNCTIHYCPNGIYGTTPSMTGGIYGCHFHHNTFYDLGIVAWIASTDSHAIGIQGGHDNIIEYNEAYNCGTGLTCYAFTNQELKNYTVRYNFFHDLHQLGGAGGDGIEFACNNDSLSDKSGNYIYYNIIANCPGHGFTLQFEDTLYIWNNVVFQCGTSFWSNRSTGGSPDTGPDIQYRNNISVSPTYYHIRFDYGNATVYSLSSDYNLFYPDTANRFRYHAVDYTFSGWQGLSIDLNSSIADPLFVNGSGNYSLDADFQIPSNSPAKDAGTDVGLTEDYFGNAIPQGDAPDIGVHEYVVGGNPIHTIKLAPGTKVKIGAGAKIRIKN